MKRKFKIAEHYQERFELLAQVLNLNGIPQQIECFDVSHHSGEATVASCVMFTVNGPAIQQYRRFNIRNVTEGDDYNAMRQAIYRRYRNRLETGASLPDLVLLDGGKGQLNVAKAY